MPNPNDDRDLETELALEIEEERLYAEYLERDKDKELRERG